MTRILVVYQHLPHYRRDIFHRLDSLATADFVFLASAKGEGGISVLGDGDVRHFKPAPYKKFGSLMIQPRAVREVMASKYDVVIALGDPHYLTTWILAVICLVRGVPVAFWTHGWTRHQRTFKSFLKNVFFRLPNHLLLYSERAKAIGKLYGFPESQMTTIYNSVPGSNCDRPGEFSEVRGRLSSFIASNSGPFVGAVIRLRKEKRLDLLVEAVSIARRSDPRLSNLAVVLAGDGPARNSLEALASNAGVPALFLGEVYGDSSLAAIYDALSLTVVPDKVGLTAIQSLSFGVPVITHSDLNQQMPEVEAIVEGRTGFLFDSGQPDSLSDALIRGLAVCQTSGSDLVEQCRSEVAEKWNAEVQLTAILGAIRKMMGS